jgi:ankyrin repeat protein
MGSERSFRVLCDAIVAGDAERVLHLLTRDPALSRYATTQGATRLDAERFFLAAIARHLTLGDTALHIASASQKPSLVRLFLERGADVCVRNRLGATPLHAAVGGGPTLPHTDGARQAETITLLVQAGADPNLPTKHGATPLHTAARNRSAAAARALLDLGADPLAKNGNGSTPLHLALQTTGRGGSGTAVARAEQRRIVELLVSRGAKTTARDAKGKTPKALAKGTELEALMAGALAGDRLMKSSSTRVRRLR